MTLRTPLVVLAALAPLMAGCQDGGSTGSADLDGIAEGSPFEQVSYNVGFQSGQQFLGQDSSFNYDRFLAGFNAGLDGDSVEIAYALGLQYGLQLAQDTMGTFDRDLFLAGVRSALAGDSLRLSDAQVQRAQTTVEDSVAIRELRARAQTDPQAQARLRELRANQVQADSFLAAVRQREGVQELGEGVLYVVEAEGEGDSPSEGDRVAVRYQGRFANGEVFDQSGDEPAVFAVGQVVPGFRDALLDMQEGETRTIFVPPAQAYGILGSPRPGGQGGIPPNAALEFDVTLLEVLDMRPPSQLPPGMAPGGAPTGQAPR